MPYIIIFILLMTMYFVRGFELTLITIINLLFAYFVYIIDRRRK